MHALLVVHSHLAIVRQVDEEIKVLDQVGAAVIEMNRECAALMGMKAAIIDNSL